VVVEVVFNDSLSGIKVFVFTEPFQRANHIAVVLANSTNIQGRHTKPVGNKLLVQGAKVFGEDLSVIWISNKLGLLNMRWKLPIVGPIM
jgi:hypothetical protein